MIFRIFSRRFISPRVTVASFVSILTFPAAVVTTRPSIAWRRSSSFGLTTSMSLAFRASVSVLAVAFRTHSSARSIGRPRFSAMVRMYAAASLVTFFSMVLSIWPPMATGAAAPMLVPGAMAAMCAASVMKAPAEAARAPLGAT